MAEIPVPPDIEAVKATLSPDFAARFAIKGILGAGSQGAVLDAFDRKNSLRVALKVLPVVADGGAVLRFQQEAAHLVGIRHPNVVRLLETGTDAGRPFLVFEAVTGITLVEHLARMGGLPVGEALEIILQVLAGLGACHARDVLHRDVTSSNILLSSDGWVKVADLGLAWTRGAAPEADSVEVLPPGTPAYMAPECLAGGAATVASDLYSVGVVFHECLTGSLPFEAKDPFELLALHRQLSRPAVAPAELPPAIVAFLEQLLSVDAARRPPSCEEAALTLRRRALGMSTATVDRAVPGSRGLRLAGALALGLAAIAFALASLRAPDPPRQSVPATGTLLETYLRSAEDSLARGDRASAAELVESASREAGSLGPSHPDRLRLEALRGRLDQAPRR